MKGKILTTLNERDTFSDMLNCELEVMAKYASAISVGRDKQFIRDMKKNYSECEENKSKVISVMETKEFITCAEADEGMKKQVLSEYAGFLNV